MFVYDLTYHFKGNPDDFEYYLMWYHCALSGNNQIIFEALNISGNPLCRTARVTIPFKDSLDEKYNSADVNEAFKKLKPYLMSPVEIAYIGEDFTYNEDFADGKDVPYYVLCIHPHLRDISPVCCGKTKLNIPYYLLPKISAETISALTAWEVNYAAYDQLLLATGIGEISAHKMLSTMSSRLNQKGFEVCRRLEKDLGKDVYYYLYRFYGKQPKKCPICNSEWKQDENSVYDYKCDKCKIVADKAMDE